MNEIYFLPIILCLIIFSALFSALETAISVSSKAKLYRFSKNGDIKASIALKLHEKLGLVISVILACNTLLNIVSTSLATSFLISYFGDFGTAISPIIMGPLIWIGAEVLPKMFAIYAPEKLFLKFSKLLNFIFILFSPFNHVVNSLASFILKLCGINIHEKDHSANLDELKGAIDLHQSINTEDTRDEKAMLKSILDLGTVTVGEIMVHRKNVTAINIDDPIDEIVAQVLESPFSRLPLWQTTSDNIIGVVHVKGLLKAIRAEKKLDKETVLKSAQKAWFIPENTDLLEQLKAFRARREHFANVVDEYGVWLGIVTLEDVLEEIVGEISDEHDVTFKGVRPQKDGSYIVDGAVTIRDLNREFDWQLPVEDASTLAGLVIYQFRTIPTVGQIFTFQNFRFEILRRQRNQIKLIRVIPILKHTQEK
jgi:Mg2+/Co2+ transporter CorB